MQDCRWTNRTMSLLRETCITADRLQSQERAKERKHRIRSVIFVLAGPHLRRIQGVGKDFPAVRTYCKCGRAVRCNRHPVYGKSRLADLAETR
jgi:hypothetical protein